MQPQDRRSAMASAGDGNGAAAAVDISGKFVVAEALTRLGGSVARYDVKLVAGGYRTYVEADVPVPPGSAEAGPVLVRCAGGVQRELCESEESGAAAFLRVLGDRFGARAGDEAELRRALEEKRRMGLLQYEHIMTFDVMEDASFQEEQEGSISSSGVPALMGRCAL